ncbi:hypothetical protein ISN45_At01g059120 [Arabidopsis thaliana x Arabidopsis arenosa]|uniref:Uncharacterized protein n=3 Tax=Arabidopsis TaxID=3701 RepID=F4HXA7_ARATH|nr:uncharacterized protein AT1G68526 [Arabidopsis thaliana]AEE34803.1 hypothetical protein AT1G68526 [Arabidopsis thaliana]KAG7651008.1 hypothetical protein ISN45_At01g059120 [Arabidopsis thaliana x Arabidopsis arenosa]KAG7658868.1 hypothetical protein ISN44_As01g058140 [Arabidopsis suecica]|eukprot:NP_001154458.1 hypothetical protein AT1G68526 [Arabidopsis thaliana]
MVKQAFLVRMQVINSKVYQRRFNPHEVMKKMSKSWSLRRDVWKGILRRMQRMIMRLMMLTTLINKRFCHQISQQTGQKFKVNDLLSNSINNQSPKS